MGVLKLGGEVGYNGVCLDYWLLYMVVGVKNINHCSGGLEAVEELAEFGGVLDDVVQPHEFLL